jgi:hypothetical protein
MQTCTTTIQIACELKQRNRTNKLLPYLGAHGLCDESIRHSGEPPRIALLEFGHQR